MSILRFRDATPGAGTATTRGSTRPASLSNPEPTAPVRILTPACRLSAPDDALRALVPLPPRFAITDGRDLGVTHLSWTRRLVAQVPIRRPVGAAGRAR